MSQKEMMDTLGHQEVGESSIENLSKLAGLARQAYDQKRTKDCLDLTRAILLIDPDNTDAHWIRSSVQSQIHQDLENARAFLLQARPGDGSEDPAPSPAHAPMPLDSERENVVPPGQEPLRLVPASSGTRSLETPLVVGGLVLLFFLFGGFLTFLIRHRPTQPLQRVSASDASKPTAQANLPGPGPLAPAADPGPAPSPGPEPPPTPAAIPSAPGPGLTVEQRSTTDKASALPLPASPPIAKQDLPSVAVVKGTLAVSSPTSVDIYEGDQYLGSAPVSLELPAGVHTLEYRHGNLRKTVTHSINANDTARTMITFDATVQINSRPWAEVFLDGIERKDLGQTPLSGVHVPIGGVLIFQNPQFQPKKYRVTGNETGIQMVFP